MAATWLKHRCEGFDCQLAADLPKSFDATAGGTKIATANTPLLYGEGVSSFFFRDTLGTALSPTTYRFAAWVQRGGSDTPIFYIEEATDTQVGGVTLTATGGFEARRGSGAATGTSPNLLGSTSAGIVPSSTWVFVQVIYYIHDSAGVVYVFASDMTTPVLSLTGVDTRAGAAAGIRIFSNTAAIDDYHLSVGTGVPVVGDALPVSRVFTRFALTQGDHSDLTPNTGTSHVAVVADRPSGMFDGDTTFLSGNSVGDRESLLVDDLPLDVSTINWNQVTAAVRKDDAATRSVKLGTRRAGTDTDAADNYLGAAAAEQVEATYRYLHFAQDEDPNTSAPWTVSNANLTQAMLKIEV